MQIIAKGIDVATFQKKIDWKKVKADGIQFAMIRGGYGKNSSQKDEYFETNYKNAKAAGMPVGVYHYSYATTVEGAKKEADFCLSYLKGKQFEYPIAYDVEDTSQAHLSKTALTNIVKAFCTKVQNAGYYVVIYASKSWLTDKLDMNVLKNFDVWVAQYNDEVTYKGNYGMWQYSSKGRVSGISGSVDMDYAYKNYPSIIKNAGLNGFSKAAQKPTTSTKPAARVYKKGEAVQVKNKPLYASATAKSVSARKTGTYYIYDGQKVNGRYRVTVNHMFCGKKPIGLFVSGWMEL